MIKTVILVIFSFMLVSCAVSKAIYLGPDDHTYRTGPELSSEIYHAENINGKFSYAEPFPEAVHIKTRTQSFNLYHYYIIHEGRIWYKSIDPEKEPKNWTLFAKTGLPNKSFNREKTKKIAEISADADELVALSAEGNFYRYCFDATIAHKSNTWLDKQGWPVEEQLYFDNRTAANRAWALGKRNSHVLYFDDIFGNQHHNGTMEIATTYVLLEDGQEICYADPGVPSDFSRNYIGPERGTFKAVNLSASASTMFVINEAGEMYTRLADFDTVGCDPMWFKYTYIPYTSNLSGSNYFSNLNEWGLPSEGWRTQPRIPLAGKASVTRHITILQNGQGNVARELRVAGLDEEGRTGYWSKAIFADEWEFKTVPLFFTDNAIMLRAETYDPEALGERGLSIDKSYAGYRWKSSGREFDINLVDFRWKGSEREDDWEYAIPNFNILEGDCDFLISWQGETCVLKLHPIEMWTYVRRDYAPGRTGSPKMFMVTMEIPENAFDELDDAFVQRLTEKFLPHDKVYFQYAIAVTDNYIVMRDTDNNDSVFFMTDGTISSRYPELHIGRYIENFGELQRYYSPELTIDKDTSVTVEDLKKKIALNDQFLDEIKYQIRVLKWSQLTAFKISAGYLPTHYIVKLTPLRFVDAPKLRTMTSYGERLVLTNSAYVKLITNTRIDLHEKIIKALELRIRCYNDLARELSKKSASDGSLGAISIPPWYSDNIADYWDIAGFPRTISGAFFSPGLGNETPAVLSFIPAETEQGISGWFFTIGEFAIGESNNYSIFLEARDSIEKVYSRKGKTPFEKKLKLNSTLYINENTDNIIEQEIIKRCLRPYLMGIDEGVSVRINFDGKTFEIREHPARHVNYVIFRGTVGGND